MQGQRYLLLIVITVLLFQPPEIQAQPRILVVASGETISYAELLTELEQTQVVFIGEHHDHAGHHRMQLEVIRGLDLQKRPLAIGLEMFQAHFQEQLDRWTDHLSSEAEFEEIYRQNWEWWPLYRPIFVYARQNRIPMVGLNLPRTITLQIARSGFESLDAEQIEALGGITCVTDLAYEEFIRRALGAHGHGSFNFQHFCEAQLVWDKVMANNLLDYLDQNPQRKIAVLAGSGHAWKYGIPAQMRNLGFSDYRVILPEVRERLTRTQVTVDDADYLWLDAGADAWSESPSALNEHESF